MNTLVKQDYSRRPQMNFPQTLVTDENSFIAAARQVLNQIKTEYPECFQEVKGNAIDLVELGRDDEESNGWSDWGEAWDAFKDDSLEILTAPKTGEGYGYARIGT